MGEQWEMSLSSALALAGHEAQPPGLQRIGDLLLHGQGNVRVETLHTGDRVLQPEIL
jgi:hypothetical protein